MELTRDAIAKLAELARLRLSDEEAATYQHALEAILAHVERLQGYVTQEEILVDRRIVEDAAQLRDDTPTPALDAAARRTFLDPARTNDAGALIVPSVFGDRS